MGDLKAEEVEAFRKMFNVPIEPGETCVHCGQRLERLICDHPIPSGVSGHICTIEGCVRAALEEAPIPAVAEFDIGRCPHGNILCFYCWRDAGFPGGAR